MRGHRVGDAAVGDGDPVIVGAGAPARQLQPRPLQDADRHRQGVPLRTDPERTGKGWYLIRIYFENILQLKFNEEIVEQ